VVDHIDKRLDKPLTLNSKQGKEAEYGSKKLDTGDA
jgi:hypothetical protein